MGYKNFFHSIFIVIQTSNNERLFIAILLVQIETTACNRGPGRPKWDPFCVCAVAVRAGADVFVIDRCPYKPIRIKYMSCNENLLDARKLDEKNYRVGFFNQ